MTWSIIARDPANGAYGIAIASKFFAVGALCPHGEGGVGALSTQSLPNPLWGYRGMRLLREGMPARAVIEHLTRPDAGAARPTPTPGGESIRPVRFRRWNPPAKCARRSRPISQTASISQSPASTGRPHKRSGVSTA